MELKDFVKKVTLDLIVATEEIKNESTRFIHLIDTGDQRTIEFDIAVSVEHESSAGGRAGIRVWSIVEGGGDITKESRNSTVSRIKFGMHVDAKTKEEKEKYEAQLAQNVAENKKSYQTPWV